MTESQKIVKWNLERGLIGKPEDVEIENEMSYILEEVIEAMSNMKSKEARPYAQKLSKVIRHNNLVKLIELIDENNLTEGEVSEITDEQFVDACADIKVFATGSIRKMGYDPDIVQAEVQKEIDSRTGKIINGKFVKDQNIKKYKADFTKAKIN